MPMRPTYCCCYSAESRNTLSSDIATGSRHQLIEQAPCMPREQASAPLLQCRDCDGLCVDGINVGERLNSDINAPAANVRRPGNRSLDLRCA